MLRLYPEQLCVQLNQELRSAYLLLGNDPFLLQESQDLILQVATRKGFDKHHTFQIDNSTDWKAIFSVCQMIGLFTSQQTLILFLPENGPNRVINERLATLVRILHRDLLLIVCGNKLTKAQENANWFLQLGEKSVLVACQTPEKENLSKWLALRARQNNLQLDKPASQLLCYCYEGNLLALAQILNQLSMLWPDGKLTLPRVKQAVHDATHFTHFHWVDALLEGKSKRAFHILQQLRFKGSNPIILLRTLQRELLLLITLNRQSTTSSLHAMFNKYRIWKNRWEITTRAINRLNPDQLRQAIHLLTQSELTLRKNDDQSIWFTLESLSLLLCHKILADVFING